MHSTRASFQHHEKTLLASNLWTPIQQEDLHQLICNTHSLPMTEPHLKDKQPNIPTLSIPTRNNIIQTRSTSSSSGSRCINIDQQINENTSKQVLVDLTDLQEQDNIRLAEAPVRAIFEPDNLYDISIEEEIVLLEAAELIEKAQRSQQHTHINLAQNIQQTVEVVTYHACWGSGIGELATWSALQHMTHETGILFTCTATYCYEVDPTAIAMSKLSIPCNHPPYNKEET